MQINSALVILLSALIFSQTFGEPLSREDLKQLQTYELNQSVSFETYTQSDKGAANVLGYHFDAFLNKHWFVGMGIFGAVGGDRGGYGIASVGGGYRQNALKKGFADVRVLVGSGGGGGVPAGGGFSVQSEVGIYYPICKSSLLGFARGGYLWFPSGDFRSPTFALGVTYKYKVPYLAY